MKIGIVGATGLVGRTMLQVLEERGIVINDLRLFSSSRSEGTKISCREKTADVVRLEKEHLKERYDFFLFAAGRNIALEYAPIAEKAGNVVIDNSSAFRKTRPLIVPEINGSEIKDYRGIIANPNCSTIQLVLALAPLHQNYGLSNLVISTYQSVSGAGNKGIQRLYREREDERRNTQDDSPFPCRIDLNIIPQIGEIDSEGNCEEENKMKYEIGRILGIKDIAVEVTTVRVPVLYGHSESVYVQLKSDFLLEDLSRIWNECPWIEYRGMDYITPYEIGSSDKSYICRVRKGAGKRSLLFWNVANNIRLGAATNAVNIIDRIMNNRL